MILLLNQITNIMVIDADIYFALNAHSYIQVDVQNICNKNVCKTLLISKKIIDTNYQILVRYAGTLNYFSSSLIAISIFIVPYLVLIFVSL